MDYTDPGRVHDAMDSKETSKDPILADYISRASRLIDQLCTGQPNVSDYFKQETILNEILTNGVINTDGVLTVYPHKPIIQSVQALSYRYRLSDAWISADLTRVIPIQESVEFEGSLKYNDRVYAQVSYTGGLAATLDNLPLVLVEAATVMAVRLYKEARSGLSDSIGVAELGTLIYTKAFPVRVIESLHAAGYMRMAPWI